MLAVERSDNQQIIMNAFFFRYLLGGCMREENMVIQTTDTNVKGRRMRVIKTKDWKKGNNDTLKKIEKKIKDSLVKEKRWMTIGKRREENR